MTAERGAGRVVGYSSGDDSSGGGVGGGEGVDFGKEDGRITSPVLLWSRGG